MEYNIAIFDVDGTIINGNCTDIFLQYLLENNLIEQPAFTHYYFLSRKHLSADQDYSNIAQEAFKILSLLEYDYLIKQWKKCFESRIRNNFNTKTVKHINYLRNNQVDIYLATGSPKLLISDVGYELGIRNERIIGTDLIIENNHLLLDPFNSICIGNGKREAVTNELKQRGISLSEVQVYSDNIADLELLSAAGQSFWMGNQNDYEKHQMNTRGIGGEFIEAKKSVVGIRNESEFSDFIYSYYQEKKPFIEKSIRSIFPLKSSIQSLEHLIGKNYKQWDLETLQSAYFNPVNEYILKQNDWMISLGPIIFLESGNMDIKKHIPIISIGELLNISHEIFTDIVNWTAPDNYPQNEKSHIEISVYGNASLSLLTLPSHNIIFNSTGFDKTKKLHFYEIYTSIVFDTLFGNGMRFFWEQQDGINININGYFMAARLMNKGIFQYASSVYLILTNQLKNSVISGNLEQLVDHFSTLSQLEKDYSSYKRWLNNMPQKKTNPFVLNTNFLSMHAAKYYNNPKIISKKDSREEINEILNSSGSIQNLVELINKNWNAVGLSVAHLPFKERYKKLLLHYMNYLIAKYA